MGPLEEVRSYFKTLLGWGVEDLKSVDFVVACYVSTFLPGAIEKAWGELIGGASSGKGELIRTLEQYGKLADGTEGISVTRHTLTSNAFSSAYRDEKDPTKDPSLTYALSWDRPPVGPKVMLLPELTPFYVGSKDMASKFQGGMRAAFDGEYQSQAGNIGHVSYKCQFGSISACTEISDLFRRDNQVLGERTLICRLARESSATYANRGRVALAAISVDSEAKELIRHAARKCVHLAMDKAIARIKGGSRSVIPAELQAKVAMLGVLGTSIRTVPHRDGTFVSCPELPARFTRQLLTLGSGRVLFDDRTLWGEEDYQLCRKIAQDTMLPDTFRLIKAFWREGTNPGERMDLHRASGIAQMPYGTAEPQCEQWTMIDVMKKWDDGAYSLGPEFVADVRETNFLEN